MTTHPLTHPQSKTGLQSLWVWIAAVAVVWIFQFFFVGYVDPYYFSIVMYSGINATLAVSLNLVNGFTGQFSMGHAGFMSVGGYVSALTTSLVVAKYPGIMGVDAGGPGIEGAILLVGALFLGGLVASLAGFLVGLPSLRLKGDYLAIVTLGFGEIIRVIVLNLNVVGGARGMANIPALTNFGWVFSVCIFTVFTIWRIVNSAHGRRFLSVREDEIAAEAMGVNTTAVKVRAFVMGAFFAGVAGGLFAHYLRYLNPQTFDFNRSFEIVIMVVLGGMGSITGSVLAALLLTVLKEALRPLQEITRLDFRMVIYSLMLIILMLNKPNGLMGTREISDVYQSFREKLRVRFGANQGSDQKGAKK